MNRRARKFVLNRSVLLAVALIPLLALPLLSGCQDSGDLNRATNLIENANARYKAFFEEYADLADQIEKFFAGYSHVVKPTAAEARASMPDFRNRLQALQAKVKRAREPYQKVLAMKGLGQYKEYVKLRLQMLDQIDKTADVAARAFLLVAAAINKGKVPDATGLEGAKRELIGIEMELSFIEAQADQLASDSGLEVNVTPPSP